MICGGVMSVKTRRRLQFLVGRWDGQPQWRRPGWRESFGEPYLRCTTATKRVPAVASPRETQQGEDLDQPRGNTGGLSSWFAALKRRRVFRALVGYGIAA